MKKEIEIDDIFNVAVETANAMCNPDEWRFTWDTLEPGNIVLNCARKGGFTCVDDVENALGYCRDLSDVIEKSLNDLFGEEWYCHSEANVWIDGGDGDFWPKCNEDAKAVTCVQCQFFNN